MVAGEIAQQLRTPVALIEAVVQFPELTWWLTPSLTPVPLYIT